MNDETKIGLGERERPLTFGRERGGKSVYVSFFDAGSRRRISC